MKPAIPCPEDETIVLDRPEEQRRPQLADELRVEVLDRDSAKPWQRRTAR